MQSGWSSGGEVEKIRLEFKTQDGESTYYKVEKSTKFQGLVKAFCKKRKMEPRTLSFICDGKRLPYSGTITEVGLMDQDEIQVMISQIGA